MPVLRVFSRMSRGGQLAAILVAATILFSGRSWAAEVSGADPIRAPGDQAGRPRIALVLSGGGARGFSHVGILKALEEEGIPFDLLVGTSMGAIVGSLYACGYSPQEIEEMVRAVNWVQLLSKSAPRSDLGSERYGAAHALVSLRLQKLEPQMSPGLLPAQRLYELFLSLTGGHEIACKGDFDSLMVPLRIVAADLKSGQPVVFSHGHLARAILASMAIPFLFPPVPWGDSLLVDGGLLDNMPVDVARTWGADVVLAVDVSSIGEREVQYEDLIDVFRRTMDIWMTRTNQLYREKPDLLLKPYLEQRSPLDYASADTIMALGYRYARAVLDSVRLLIPWRTDWGLRRERYRLLSRAKVGSVVATVELTGTARSEPLPLRSEIELRPGMPFQVGTVVSDLRRLYDTGLFDHVSARLEARPGGRVAVAYEVRERHPLDLCLGGSYVSREGEAAFVQLRHLNLLGRGPRGLLSYRVGPQRDFVAAELHSRSFLGRALGVQTALFWERNRPLWYEGGRAVARRVFDEAGIQVTAKRGLRGLWSISAAASATSAVGRRVPEIGLNRRVWRTRSFALTVRSSSLDDPYWTTRGSFHTLQTVRFFRVLGGTTEGGIASWVSGWFLPVDRMILGGTLRATISGTGLPPELWPRLGGPEEFQGLERGELWTPCFLAATGEIKYAATGILRWAFGLGLSWASHRPGKLLANEPFFGARVGARLLTLVGIVSLDLAYGEGGRSAYYLTVGYPF
ncbi:MAG: patatin-like phospholipase family protein [candidate division KSB1 bacterium]|nr:patatin-like phospholipase family protein [candidate division KSB1 bacterium]